ncbi:MAG: hypothetical protein CM1200mP4_4790 [Rhodospirillaceae bacterium]|nr:MAG: hypothetical protein CM1200mP4_4790 [Rhodospirillaceae bacterium]
MLALIFERPSTRTRVSFQVAMSQMGGQTVVLAPEDTQLGRGESMADTARVLSEYVDGIMIRAERHETLRELARFSGVPVINGLTDKSHPCQLMADIMTFEEHSGPIAGRVVAWSGDGNNVAASWVHAAVRFWVFSYDWLVQNRWVRILASLSGRRAREAELCEPRSGGGCLRC